MLNYSPNKIRVGHIDTESFDLLCWYTGTIYVSSVKNVILGMSLYVTVNVRAWIDKLIDVLIDKRF